ncbi:MAG: T9SS type A sorting domain-containing protein, partial [Bacteroidota bacterium]
SFDGDTPGNLRTALDLGGTGNDSGRGVAASASFDVPAPGDASGESVYAIVAGTFQGSASAFGETIQSAGSNDAFVAKQATCPGPFCYSITAEEDTPEASGVRVRIAPNPAVDASTVTVTLDTPRALRLDLFDARGRRVATLHDGARATGDVSIALPSLPAGNYLVRATTPEATLSRVVTVAR